jgi:hypothetical protein
VQYWVDVSNYAAETGDVDELQRISHKQCEGCSAYIDLYSKTYSAGGYFRGSPWQISDVTVRRGPKESLISVHVDADEGTYKTSRASKVKHGNAEDSELVFGAKFTGRSWVMTQMGLASELKK